MYVVCAVEFDCRTMIESLVCEREGEGGREGEVSVC